jgi:hypothetical protein
LWFELRINRCPVSGKKIGCQPVPGPAATYFGGYFYLMVNNWMFGLNSS